MAKKSNFFADIDHLLQTADMQLKRAGKEKKKKTPCKRCGGLPIIYRGLCQKCVDEDRNKNEAAKVGKRWISTNGYEYIYADGMKPTLYHRFRMEQLLGRPLQEHEQVGHKNGIKADNADDNLILTVKSGFDLSSLRCSHCDHPYIALSELTASSYEENSPTTEPDLSGLAGS